MARLLISIGLSLVLMGVIWHFGRGLGLGQLPGDISIKKGNTTFYFPVVTCLVLSLVLSLIFWIFGKFRS
ncbi:DUF2905 domain-containing protein [Oligoflexus tunisiensis]|uniref:DUF2905 domain-containing protein n=1 Tax=Oligoflexus tunisiensis TaxID=708132 RepID=UPI000A3F90DC|nr:DUF2905 domain-containing protein [Oligoflexus tunisiensis]